MEVRGKIKTDLYGAQKVRQAEMSFRFSENLIIQGGLIK